MKQVREFSIIEQATVHVNHRDKGEDLIRKGRDSRVPGLGPCRSPKSALQIDGLSGLQGGV